MSNELISLYTTNLKIGNFGQLSPTKQNWNYYTISTEGLKKIKIIDDQQEISHFCTSQEY